MGQERSGQFSSATAVDGRGLRRLVGFASAQRPPFESIIIERSKADLAMASWGTTLATRGEQFLQDQIVDCWLKYMSDSPGGLREHRQSGGFYATFEYYIETVENEARAHFKVLEFGIGDPPPGPGFQRRLLFVIHKGQRFELTNFDGSGHTRIKNLLSRVQAGTVLSHAHPGGGVALVIDIGKSIGRLAVRASHAELAVLSARIDGLLINIREALADRSTRDGNGRVALLGIAGDPMLAPRPILVGAAIRPDLARIIGLHRLHGRAAAASEFKLGVLARHCDDAIMDIREATGLAARASAFVTLNYDLGQLVAVRRESGLHAPHRRADFRIVSASAQLALDKLDFIIAYNVRSEAIDGGFHVCKIDRFGLFQSAGFSSVKHFAFDAPVYRCDLPGKAEGLISVGYVGPAKPDRPGSAKAYPFFGNAVIGGIHFERDYDVFSVIGIDPDVAFQLLATSRSGGMPPARSLNSADKAAAVQRSGQSQPPPVRP